MYTPPQFKVDEKSALRMISKHPFATVVSFNDPLPTISHIPLYLVDNKLYGHFAKANSHSKAILTNPTLFIFHGPHHYISPEWYTDSPANVPTWNYAVVHVKGKIRVVDNEDIKHRLLSTFVKQDEQHNQTNWQLPDTAAVRSQLNGIVMFEVDDLAIEGKFKMSQNHGHENRNTVIRNLENKPNDNGKKVAALMKSTPIQQ